MHTEFVRLEKKTNLAMFFILVIVLLACRSVFADTDREYHFLTISFFSVCCGPDVTAINRINQYLSKYQQENNIQLKERKIYWGEEGESDYCIEAINLSEQQINDLLEGLEEAKGDSELTDIFMANACRPYH